MLTAMQSLISFFAIVALAILPQLVFSEEAPTHPVKPLLWKIEGKGLSKPSYLFGTIHLGSGPLAKLHPAAEAAFEQSDVLYTEIPFDQKTQLGATRLLLRNDQKTLVQSIGEKLKNRLDEELAAINPQLDSEPFQSLKTWAVAATLPMLKAQIGGEQAMDGTLWQRAEADEKKTDSIETVESQLGVFDAFNEEEQIIMLSETLKMMKEDRLAKKDSMQELIDAYVTGDLQSLQKTLDKSLDEMRKGEHKELGERFYKKLLTDRDASMAEVIVKKLANSPGDCHFFAAGAAHFAGDKSIRAHLEKAGYKITRIEK
jgi:uncharacterized protein YbaP (TraB family)